MPPLFELWVKDKAIACNPIKMSFLAIKIGKDNHWPKEKIQQISAMILASKYSVTPDTSHGGCYYVLVDEKHISQHESQKKWWQFWKKDSIQPEYVESNERNLDENICPETSGSRSKKYCAKCAKLVPQGNIICPYCGCGSFI